MIGIRTQTCNRARHHCVEMVSDVKRIISLPEREFSLSEIQTKFSCANGLARLHNTISLQSRDKFFLSHIYFRMKIHTKRDVCMCRNFKWTSKASLPKEQKIAACIVYFVQRKNID